MAQNANFGEQTAKLDLAQLIGYGTDTGSLETIEGKAEFMGAPFHRGGSRHPRSCCLKIHWLNDGIAELTIKFKQF